MVKKADKKSVLEQFQETTGGPIPDDGLQVEKAPLVPTNEEKPKKHSPLFGQAKTWLKVKDKAIATLIENGINRWLKSRKEYCDSLPQVTREELLAEGFLDAPELKLPASAVTGVAKD